MLPVPPGLTVIGAVRSAHTDRAGTPVQAALNREETAAVHLHGEFTDGLDGLAGFDYAWLLTWLGGTDEPPEPVPLRQVPFLLQARDPRAMGIFATRGPRRVNPIGLSLVQLLAIEADRVVFAGVDLLDGTPVLDIKPYVAAFDRPAGDPRCGWFDTAELPPGATPASLRPPPPSAS